MANVLANPAVRLAVLLVIGFLLLNPLFALLFGVFTLTSVLFALIGFVLKILSFLLMIVFGYSIFRLAVGK